MKKKTESIPNNSYCQLIYNCSVCRLYLISTLPAWPWGARRLARGGCTLLRTPANHAEMREEMKAPARTRGNLLDGQGVCIRLF